MAPPVPRTHIARYPVGRSGDELCEQIAAWSTLRGLCEAAEHHHACPPGEPVCVAVEPLPPRERDESPAAAPALRGRRVHVGGYVAEASGHRAQRLVVRDARDLAAAWDDAEPSLALRNEVADAAWRHREPRTHRAAEAAPGASVPCEMHEALEATHVALERSHAHVRMLTGRLIAAQEEERRRISLELHDAVSQRIAAACIALEHLRDGLADHGAAAQQVGDVLEVLGELAAGVRNLSHTMHPSVLEVAGLGAALRSHCAELRRLARLEVEVAAESLPRIPREVGMCLYRVAQEALANVVAHSGVRRARLRVEQHAGEVEMEVSDHGRGFDSTRVCGGLGLTGMMERVRLLRGSFAVDTRIGAGTIVRVRLPLGCAEWEPAHA